MNAHKKIRVEITATRFVQHRALGAQQDSLFLFGNGTESFEVRPERAQMLPRLNPVLYKLFAAQIERGYLV
jgi:hypothetical protein